MNLPNLNLGPLRLPPFIVIFLAAYLAGSFLLRRIRGKQDHSVQWAERHVSNALLIGFLLWKLSPLLFHFTSVRSRPLALLYLPGGTAGMILGVAGGLGYLIFLFFRAHKAKKGLIKTSGLYLLLMGAAGGAAMLILLLFQPGTGEISRQQAAAAEGQPAAGFSLPDTEGMIHDLKAYRGKWVILNFWASWCPPCRAELPELKEFSRLAEPEKAVLLGINLTTTEKQPEQLPGFIRDEGIDFTVLFDRNGDAARAYGIESIPATAVIDPEGNLRALKTGAVTRSWIESRID